MGSRSTSTTVRRKRGFAEADLQTFMQLGQTQAGQPSNLNIASYRPQEVEQQIRTTTKRKSGIFGSANYSTTDVGGFTDQFANITSEQLDNLTNVFLSREQEIKGRRAQPGTSSLFLKRA